MNQLLLVIFFSFPLFGSLVSLVQFLWPLLGGHFVASCGWMALDGAGGRKNPKMAIRWRFLALRRSEAGR